MNFKIHKRVWLAAIALILVFVFVARNLGTILLYIVTPSHEFAPVGHSPDYSKLESWLAHPDKYDTADILASGDVDGQKDAKIDVFFIHPTSYIGVSGWNDPLDGSGEYLFEKSKTIIGNGSLFNGVGRVFSPIYRQAHFATYFQNPVDVRPLNFASQDILKAFDYYIEHFNQGRPFILAAHSQGADHALVLLKKRISGRKLKNQFIVGFLVGRSIAKKNYEEQIPDLPICNHPTQTQCIVSWVTYSSDESGQGMKNVSVFLEQGLLKIGYVEDIICSNPLSWLDDGALVPGEQNKGQYIYDAPSNQLVATQLKVSAQCKDGILTVVPSFYELYPGNKNFHRHDYRLFYKNIRENLELRTKVFLNQGGRKS